MYNRESSAQRFLDLIQHSRKGKFKLYVGMSAGVGKTYRMLQEAHTLLENHVNIQIGFIETHNRKETHALLPDIPTIPTKVLFYKGQELEEMNLEAILLTHPEIVIVDELAHSNIPGSKNEKRWQDVLEILDAGINVISAVNIQHIESLNTIVQQVSGITVSERIPDSVIKAADEIVTIDIPADELITRLKAGKIYPAEKIESALNNFFKMDTLTHLRELALREVANQLERKNQDLTSVNEKLLVCIGTDDKKTKNCIRKSARIADRLHASWVVLHVQLPNESQKISLAKQRQLINNFKLASNLGAIALQIEAPRISTAIIETAQEQHATTIVMGYTSKQFFWQENILSTIIKNTQLNILIVS